VVTDILQPTHLLFILVVALLVLGPKRLPEVARTLGNGLRDFRSAISGEDHERPGQPGHYALPEDDETASSPGAEPAAPTAAPHTADASPPETAVHDPAPASHDPAPASHDPAPAPPDPAPAPHQPTPAAPPSGERTPPAGQASPPTHDPSGPEPA
jgi:TatA/E family protein of Tat protein translocase